MPGKFLCCQFIVLIAASELVGPARETGSQSSQGHLKSRSSGEEGHCCSTNYDEGHTSPCDVALKGILHCHCSSLWEVDDNLTSVLGELALYVLHKGRCS